jgi:hypothetical protein
MKKILLIALLFFIAGCMPPPPWSTIGGPYPEYSQNFYVELPNGWKKSNRVNYLLVTRDGALLQNIIITSLEIDKGLEYTKKKLKKDMLPQEVAEVIIDDLTSNPNVLNLVVIENTPAKISGHQGFKLLFTFRNREGVKYKSVYYGFIAGGKFYGIRYTAAERYYFDKDIKIFERVAESFKLINEPKR